MQSMGVSVLDGYAKENKGIFDVSRIPSEGAQQCRNNILVEQTVPGEGRGGTL